MAPSSRCCGDGAREPSQSLRKKGAMLELRLVRLSFISFPGELVSPGVPGGAAVPREGDEVWASVRFLQACEEPVFVWCRTGAAMAPLSWHRQL